MVSCHCSVTKKNQKIRVFNPQSDGMHSQVVKTHRENSLMSGGGETLFTFINEQENSELHTKETIFDVPLFSSFIQSP